jgi:hypothetical protein
MLVKLPARPQPLTAPIGFNVSYYFYDPVMDIVKSSLWDNDAEDKKLLKNGMIYLERDQAEARRNYEKVVNDACTMPQWLKELIDNENGLEYWHNGCWAKISGNEFYGQYNSILKHNFRTIRPWVVEVVDGKTFTWPATVDEHTAENVKVYFVDALVKDIQLVNYSEYVKYKGNMEYLHYTKEGAIAQLECLFAKRIQKIRMR